jgi:hypothetical protein
VTGRIACLALLIWSCHSEAAAQGFEAGAGIGRGCTGDSSGFCGDQTGPMWSLHAGFWMTEHVQIAFRIAALPLADYRYSRPRDERFNRVADPDLQSLRGIDVTDRDRRRVMSGVEAIYNFAGSSGLSAILGVGFGTVSSLLVESCEPAGCERILPALGSRVGRIESRVGNLTFLAGLSGRASRRLQISGGVRLHNFWGEYWSTTEAFTSVGLRFGAF